MGNFLSCVRLFEGGARSSGGGRRRRERGGGGGGSCAKVAKVLLVDGSVLRFKAPIKAIQVLIDHPQHFICPLDSLKPGVHSLPVLLPHEEVSLGRLYLLLPSSKALQKQQQQQQPDPLLRSPPPMAVPMLKQPKKLPPCPTHSPRRTSPLPKSHMLNQSHMSPSSIPTRRPGTDPSLTPNKSEVRPSSLARATDMGFARCRETEMGSCRDAAELGSIHSRRGEKTEMGSSPGVQRSEGGRVSKKRRREVLQQPPYPSRARAAWVPRLQTIEESTQPSSPITCVKRIDQPSPPAAASSS